MSKLLVISLAFIAGGLLAFQGAVNSELGKTLSHPLQAALISFSIGVIGLSAVIVTSTAGFPSLSQLTNIPTRLWIGGLLGATFITATIVLIPKVGVANMLVAVVAGQVVASLFVDHFGLFGVLQQSVSSTRLIGAGLVVSGLFVFTKSL